ncbi:tRNA (adenosine(37)-N6)-dimethylallyltransferase MiaA [Sphingobacterium faecale]|uniref:tRNA dimethylallyltransferase n=1 Tax=Sphingobacterium faecale TaxID=2803775 RepID=A0ABS1R614_9SPHI|nr:tRNA (adenosine(37)-N6)-dimethylallyltransferase MiaA [Sphingobacterium faecale]MBL1409447.1 tRNA (adenosine(37)-N6)-dimethylallyltransferase MiaA [Sphingobacterium faecale]
MINSKQVLEYLSRETSFLEKDILVITGPTASGKTKLAVELARALSGEIISADSRQVYRQMDIGTGKDIQEYEEIPYHLIDIADPGDQYNVSRFLEDFERAYRTIKAKGKIAIVCGGTGFYIQALLTSHPYNQIPTDMAWRAAQEQRNKQEIQEELGRFIIPTDFKIDYSSKKRMVRALEILTWLTDSRNSLPEPVPSYIATIIALDPLKDIRRQRISKRLRERLEQGMVEEVQQLIKGGLNYTEIEYYGLEYKYCSYYLRKLLNYDSFVNKLETEIHRYAKRQMTYLRKMEKDGVHIHWFTAV